MGWNSLAIRTAVYRCCCVFQTCRSPRPVLRVRFRRIRIGLHAIRGPMFWRYVQRRRSVENSVRRLESCLPACWGVCVCGVRKLAGTTAPLADARTPDCWQWFITISCERSPFSGGFRCCAFLYGSGERSQSQCGQVSEDERHRRTTNRTSDRSNDSQPVFPGCVVTRNDHVLELGLQPK